MRRAGVCLCVAILWMGVRQEPVVGQQEPLLTASPVLRASIDRIAQRSRLWREAVAGVRTSGRIALVLTPDQVVVADRHDDKKTRAFDPSVLAEVSPLPDQQAKVDVVMVVVNLPLLEEYHQRRLSPPLEFQTDLDSILTHEIYGHALPYLLAGHLSGRCADPRPGQPASEACSIQRENEVRAELGMGRRTSYGLDGLALARPAWGRSGN